MNQTILPIFAALALIIPFKVSAQDAAATPAEEAASASSPDYVSRAEYDKLKAEHDAMKKEMEALKKMVRQMANGSAPAATFDTTSIQRRISAMQSAIDRAMAEQDKLF